MFEDIFKDEYDERVDQFLEDCKGTGINYAGDETQLKNLKDLIIDRDNAGLTDFTKSDFDQIMTEKDRIVITRELVDFHITFTVHNITKNQKEK